MTPIYCDGCGATMGYTSGVVKGYTFCSPWEVNVPAVGAFEVRDAVIMELIRTDKYSMTKVAQQFGMSRQRCGQIIHLRENESLDPVTALTG